MSENKDEKIKKVLKNLSKITRKIAPEVVPFWINQKKVTIRLNNHFLPSLMMKSIV